MNMFNLRNIFVVLLAFFVTFSVMAQDDNSSEIKTLFHKKEGKNKIDNGFYASMTFGWTRIDNENAFIIGPRIAWIANHYFALGIAGGGFSNFMHFPLGDDEYYARDEYFLAGGYGGILLEPIILAKDPVHVSFPITIGGGAVTANSKNGWTDYSYYYDDDNFDVYFVFEPGVDLELNITKFFRIAAGASYRLTNELNMNYSYFNESEGSMIRHKIDGHALNAFNVKLALKFGIF